MGIAGRVRAARGEGEVDLLLVNCRLVNVLSGEVHGTSIAVDSGMVVGLGAGYAARRSIDLEGRFVVPGLIDAHVHMESSMVAVPRFAGAVVPRGTTAVITDCHEIANVMGAAGVDYIIDSAKGVPLEVFVMLPSCVPATTLETSGAVLDAKDLGPLMSRPGVLGLGELMNFPGAVAGDPSVVAKLELFAGRPVDGHAPGLTGMDLCAYIAAGPDSDHECVTAAEAEEKLEKGMYVFMREGTGARNLADLLPAMNERNSRRCCLCTDDRNPQDLLARGHIDSMLAQAVAAGVPPVTAVQMATLNTAARFGLARRGAVAPGYIADIVVLEDLSTFRAEMVFKDGELVAEGGEQRFESVSGSTHPPSTFDVRDFGAHRLRVPASGTSVRAIGLVPGQIVTDSLQVNARQSGGNVVSDTAADVLKIAVVERHHGTGNVGLGFVKGFGLTDGALASSVAHDSHNIVAVGADDGDITTAVLKVVEMQGGQAVVRRGEVTAALALPIAGLMSPLPLAEVAAAVEGLNSAAAALGCPLADPFMTMSFLALPVIPELKITDRGLVDVSRFDFVGLFER